MRNCTRDEGLRVRQSGADLEPPAPWVPVMTEQPSSKHGFLYRRGGDLLFFGLQAVVVLGIILFVVSSRDDKPILPRSHEPNGGPVAKSITFCTMAVCSGAFPGLRVLSRVNPAK
jgi:hypothetical protein